MTRPGYDTWYQNRCYEDGVVQQVDTPQNLYNAPGNLFVAGFIGSPQMNFLDAKVKVNGNDVTLTVGKYNMKLPASKAKAVIDGGYDGKTVVMGIRPENVHDSQMFIETSKDSVVECKINVYELLGAEVYLYFDCEGFPMTAPRRSLVQLQEAVIPLNLLWIWRKFICSTKRQRSPLPTNPYEHQRVCANIEKRIGIRSDAGLFAYAPPSFCEAKNSCQ